MKNIYIIGCLAAGLTLASCDDFLDKSPLDQFPNTSVYWSSPANAEAQTNRLYNNILGYGNGQTHGTFYFNFLNDDQASPSFANWTYINIPAQSSSWNSPFEQIRGCNYIITGVRSGSMADNDKKKYEGIARFMRAYQYYLLVRDYGDVQWICIPAGVADTDVVYGARTKRDIVMDSVLNDINYAVATIGDASSKTRWSSAAAAALKAEICLFEGTFRKYCTEADNNLAPDASRSKKYLEEVEKAYAFIKAKGYSLNPEYGTIYNSLDLKDNNEVIMCKAYSQPEASFGHGTIAYTNSTSVMSGMNKDAFDSFLFLDGKPLATTGMDTFDGVEMLPSKVAGVPGLVPSIAKALSTRDKRLAVLLDEGLGFGNIFWTRYAGSPKMCSSTGYVVHKFYTDQLSNYNLKTIGQNTTQAPIFYLAPVLLAYAEARAELGTITAQDLDETVNALNKRGGIPAMTLTPDADPANTSGISNLLWEIRRCRRCELMFDNFRFYDLVRWHWLDRLDSKKNPKIFLGANVSGLDISKFDNGEVEKLGATLDGDYIRVTPGMEREYASKYYLLPVPQGQIGLNSNLTQNPNW